MAERNQHPAQAVVGLNMDGAMGAKPAGSLSYALNATVQGFDGEEVTYQMEQGNEPCLSLPPQFRVVGGPFNITQIGRVIYFLANPDTGDSQIGYTATPGCTYTTLVEGVCLGLSVDHPIHELVVKTTNCSTQFYWTDNHNPRRYIDLENLPWKEVKNPDNDFKPILLTGQLDCNKLLVQPNFSVPSVRGLRELPGGALRMGVYQATIQYANVLGEGLTSFYNVSNPFGIHTPGEGLPLDQVTTKAIEYGIEGLDTSGLYDFYNIAIIRTISGIPSVELAGVAIPIKGTEDKFIYTGADTTAIPLTMEDVFLKYKYYDRAGGVTEVDDVIVWYDLASPREVNYQAIWSAVRLSWETHKIPHNTFEAYTNGANTEAVKGYMRDEVYAFEGCFLLRNGRQTASFHIPGRAPTALDLEGIDSTNPDANAILEHPCDTPELRRRWEVYNTASLTGYSAEYQAYQGAPGCYKGPYQYGQMAYWESIRTYPNNPLIWGALAGTPIRHHKFPDSLITHIHDNNPGSDPGYEHAIFPIGVRIEGLKEAIERSGLSQEEKDSIVGFKISRGNRANNKSIVAKGLFNNVGRYTYIPEGIDETDEQTYYYPNYPFNDLRPDPFFTDRKLKNHSGYRPDRRLKGFESEESRERFVFYSPDTQFYRPHGVTSGQIKLETIEYGESRGHFIPVDQNARYLFLNKNGYKIAFGAGVGSVVNGQVTYETPWSYGVGASFAPENFPGTYQAMMDLLEKILPKSNFGYSFNSVGYYNKAYPVPNAGDKIRNISFGRYLNAEYNNIDQGNVINNYQREDSVYLNASEPLLFPHQYDPSIPEDTSRYNLASYTNNDAYNKFFPIFLSSNAVIRDSDIHTAILDSYYGGSNVINIQYTGHASVPVTGNIIEYYSTPAVGSPRLLGTMQVIDYGYNNSGSKYDGDFTAILLTGEIEDITLPLQLDSSDKSGSAVATTVYKNYVYTKSGGLLGSKSAPAAGYIDTTAAPGATVGFDTLVTQSYQSYVATRPSAKDAVTNQVKAALAGVHTEADLEALNVLKPNGNGDFVKLVAYYAYLQAYSRFQQTLEKEYSPDKIRDAHIASYYGSIKKHLLDQWGDMYSYDSVDTGYYALLRGEDGTLRKSFPTIFGGDIFIGRHAFKIKLPFFEDNTVGDHDQTDIEFDKIASLTYPMFWMSTRPSDIRSNIAEFIERKAKNVIANAQTLNAFQVMVAGAAAVSMSFEIIKEVLSGLGVRNLNLDNFRSTSLYEQGIMYLFAYGIPYYFVESEVNTDFRMARDARAGNFYPNVNGEIPDSWLQEANVSILEPEQFSYNDSYSKQNKENYFPRLRPDYDPDRACFHTHNNRAVWSDKTSLEETKNNWLTYRPANYYDFPKGHGRLTALNKLQNRLVLARFENKSQLYNSMVRINTSSAEGAYVGNDSLFSGTPPQDLSVGTTGSWGSQHKFLLLTDQGTISIDARRGQVGLLRGETPEDITAKGMDKWFKHFLPFFILAVDPAIPIDNHFAGIGLTGVYDPLYKRVLITKKDYEPLVDGISYNSQGQYIFAGNVISLSDPAYFCNRSWTLSYSFITQSWTGFHSYQPDFYVEHATYFQSGLNGSVSTLWNHNTSFTRYHSYYGTTYPYILEYPVSATYEDEIFQGVKDYTKALKYTDYETFTAPKETHYFNKAVIYNDQQCSGILNLVPRQGLAGYGTYPIYHGDSKDIHVTKSDNFFNFNTFWNITRDTNAPVWNKTCSFAYTNKTLNFSNLDYTATAFTKAPIRAKECYVRLIADQASDIRLISRFIVTPTQNSKK